MEVLTGKITLKHIFLDNGNWWKFFINHRRLIRVAIIINVTKMLLCRSALLGFHFFKCPKCHRSVKAPHTCKGRFCSTCAKKATDIWMRTAFETLPNTRWQHITFTMPDLLWDFFWINRHLLNEIPALAAGIIKDQAQLQGCYPGIYLAIHTFGRRLNRNVHLHLSTTAGGLSKNHKRWISDVWFEHSKLKTMWRYKIINLFRNEYKNGTLKLPPSLKHLKTYTAFNSWLNFLYNKKWVVHLNKKSDNHKNNTQYLGKYLKRPPIGETRIKAYDGKSVTFEFLDHYTNEKELLTMPVLDFIAAVISHIPDKHFRSIRYYGFLSNRNRGKLLPIVYALLKQTIPSIKKTYISWRLMLWESFGFDPLLCPKCGIAMTLIRCVFAANVSLLSIHQKLAHGYF